MKWYGKTLKFRRGVNITLFPSYKCNIYCPYCSLAQINGKYPQGMELTLEQWKEKFDRGFPIKIKEVYISGGEPTLIRWLPDFVNYLLDKGYHVTVFSNLAVPSRFNAIKKSYRFQIRATFHHCDNAERFDKAYKKITHPIIVDEFDYQELPYSVVKYGYDDPEHWKIQNFRMGCDGSLYSCIFDHVTAMTKEGIDYKTMCKEFKYYHANILANN